MKGKKIALAMLLTAAVLCNSGITTVWRGQALAAAESSETAVDDVQIEGYFATTEQLHVTYTLGSGYDPEKTTIEWQLATESEAASGTYGEYTAVGTGDTISVTNKMATAIDLNGTVIAKRKIRVMITPYTAEGGAGTPIYSAEYEMEPALGPLVRVSNSEASHLSEVHTNTPDENVFSIGGKKFILLQEDKASRDSRYFILSKDFYPGRAIEPLNAAWKGYNSNFNPESYKEDTNTIQNKHISYWINSQEKGGFLDPDTPDGLPAEIKNHIDWNHQWKTEAYKGVEDDYRFTAGVTLLSLTELKKHADKIGLIDDLTSVTDHKSRWWLRTGYANEDKKVQFVNGFDEALGQTDRWNGNPAAIRPTFYLDEAFFRTVQLEELSNLGENVRRMITTNYTKEQLKTGAGYTDQQLALLYGEETDIPEPVVSNATLTVPYQEIGVSAILNYEYSGSGYNEGETIVKWQMSDSETEGYTDIAGQNAKTMTITNAHSAKYIRAQVIPVNSEGVAGEPLYSNVIKAAQKRGPVDRKGRINNPVINTNETNVFQVDGSDKSFILLDADKTKEDSAFFILAKDFYGEKAFDVTAANENNGYQKFDIGRTTNVGYYLNTELLSGGELPEGIKSHLDYNHRWITEAGVSSGACPNDYTTVAPLALLSQEEYLAYQDIIGVNDGVTKSGWFLRTPRGLNSDKAKVLFVYAKANGGPEVGAYDNWGILNIRPAFYLNQNFFKEVKLDVTAVGEDVAKCIREHYTMQEMLDTGLYTEQELHSVFGYAAYEIAACVYSGENPVDSIDGLSAFTVKSTVKSVRNEPVVLIAAVYDAQGRMETVELKTADLKAETAADISVEFSGLTPAPGKSVAVMLWKDMQSAAPITDTIRLFTDLGNANV